MQSNWEDFYSSAPKPKNYVTDVETINNFVAKHNARKRKIVLITSGGTTVPLEHNTVRFVDNFSAGNRGSAQPNIFRHWLCCYIFISSKIIRTVYKTFFWKYFLDVLEIQRSFKKVKGIKVMDDKVKEVLPILEKYQLAKASGKFLSISFTTLADYLWLLRACCESLSVCGKYALIYLAAAVSDFYIPTEKMSEHKIQSHEGPLNITLQLVPKVLQPLVSSWVPEAFIVSFKLETDENLLIRKARNALEKYNHHLVIANILDTRKSKVSFVTKDSAYEIHVTQIETELGIEIESKIIHDLSVKHQEFIGIKHISFTSGPSVSFIS